MLRIFLVCCGLSGCVLSEDFTAVTERLDTGLEGDASSADVSDADVSSADVSDADDVALDATDTSMDASDPDAGRDAGDDADVEDIDAQPDASCGNACLQASQFLCGQRLNDCGQTVDCDCPEGFSCDGADLCQVLPDSEVAQCDNGVDDDQDNFTDCADPDCFTGTNATHPCWGESHHVFVTRNNTRGFINPVVPPGTDVPTGAAAADRECRNAAGARGTVGAGWKAIISTKDESAATRINVTRGPVLNMRGELVARSGAGLWDGAIDHPIKYDSGGADVTQLSQSTPYVWTGSNSDGTSSGHDCDAWSNEAADSDPDGTFGLMAITNGSWLSSAVVGACHERRHIYCINGQ